MAELRALVVDWGGVLTGPMSTVAREWAADDGIDLDAYTAVMRDWLGEVGGAEARLNPIHALERGELALPDFEVRLAQALSDRTGSTVLPAGLMERMFAKLEHAPDMAGLVRRAHAAGLRTALLSNSWGNDYPRDGWDEMFDVVVISGEVGMRKPERRIFERVLAELGLPGEEGVFVDDVPAYVEAAASCGMVGVHHTSYETTRLELEALFGIDLA
jgi:epoxide hydrolase-like predicted phosphatase